MQTYTFKSLLSDLAGMDEWLEQNGINKKETRVHWAIGVLREAAEGWETFGKTGQPTRVGRAPDYPFGLVEALEFRDILLAFRNEPRQIMEPKLSHVINGPGRPSEETKKTNQPRNIQFELALASEWRHAGLSVKIGDPDITLQIQDVCLLVECKRPFADHSIRSNLLAAAKQIGKKLESQGDQAARGLIAISVSRVLNPGTRVFVAPTRSDTSRLADEVETLMQQHASVRASGISNRRIIGILFHVATVAEVEGRLERVAISVVGPVGSGGSDFDLLQSTLKGVYPI